MSIKLMMSWCTSHWWRWRWWAWHWWWSSPGEQCQDQRDKSRVKQFQNQRRTLNWVQDFQKGLQKLQWGPLNRLLQDLQKGLENLEGPPSSSSKGERTASSPKYGVTHQSKGLQFKERDLLQAKVVIPWCISSPSNAQAHFQTALKYCDKNKTILNVLIGSMGGVRCFEQDMNLCSYFEGKFASVSQMICAIQMAFCISGKKISWNLHSTHLQVYNNYWGRSSWDNWSRKFKISAVFNNDK